MSEKKERKKLFGKEDRTRVPSPTGMGRPRVNEEKLLLLLRAEQYTKVEIGKACKCDESTVRRYERGWIADGTLIYEGNKGESPEMVLISDKPILGTVILWGIIVIGILYGLG